MDKVKKCKKILKNDKIKKWIMTFKKRHDIIILQKKNERLRSRHSFFLQD